MQLLVEQLVSRWHSATHLTTADAATEFQAVAKTHRPGERSLSCPTATLAARKTSSP